MLERFEAMLADGKDSPLLRYSLGLEYLKRESFEAATIHLRAAVDADPTYSAAWKQLGNALVKAGNLEAAIDAYEAGIDVATTKGDMQASKEMAVFLRRTRKALDSAS